MHKTCFILFIVAASLTFGEYCRQPFTKVCRRCHRISYEVQLYAYNEWAHSWEKSWRSDTNRPGVCQQCYFELQPKVVFLETPKHVWNIGSEPEVPDYGNPTDVSVNYWWNNGRVERLSRTQPLIGGPWRRGRLIRH